MDTLELALVTAIVVTAIALPAGVWRTLAYRSRHIEADHTPTMRTAAAVAVALAALGLLSTVVLLVLVATR